MSDRSETARTNKESAEHAQLSALISEIWMLVDYVAGSSTKALGSIAIPDPRKPGTNLSVSDLLQQVSDTERRVLAGGELGPYDRASMQMVRDALNLLVRPASGLTVAYTAMVAGPLRRRKASRFTLAQKAYENLTWPAKVHRWLQFAILVFVLMSTGLAVWESAKVALGKALLQNLDVLRAQQASISAEKLKLEMSLAKSSDVSDQLGAIAQDHGVPLAAYRMCDRAIILRALHQRGPKFNVAGQEKSQAQEDIANLLFYSTAEERDVCGRDFILGINFGIIHSDLETYSQNWPGMVGSGFERVRNLFVCLNFRCNEEARARDPRQKDVEFTIAPVLLVWGNFVLPIIFGFIGSALSVLLDYYKRIRSSELHPRDRYLAPVRLALGLVVGACVGLFFSASSAIPQAAASPSASSLISSLTLSASGVAFLAGFGVEAVFSLLEALITRVFAAPSEQK